MNSAKSAPLLIVGIVGATVCLATVSASRLGPPPTACSAEALQRAAPSDVTITTAVERPAADGEPAHCLVDGHVTVPGNQVAFRLALPREWNGKFYFQGIGGLGGTIGSLGTGLERGYAAASTDTGHKANDPSWMGDRAKELDYGHRGTHVTAVASKAVTAAFYGRPAAHAYFNGCSNGGRQAMMEVQRYPEDFDGIIAGDPATGTPMQVGRALLYQHLLASPANYLPIDKVELLSRATLAACDARDGLTDGLVTDPRTCDFDPATLACTGAERDDCLTGGQVETVKRIYSGVRLPNGDVYTPGFPPGHEGGATGWRGWITGNEPPARRDDGGLTFGPKAPNGFGLSVQNMRALALDADDPAYSWQTLRFPDDLPKLATMSEILSPLDTNLSPYKQRGGKLLLYHGWADPGISARGTLAYYEAMTARVGGQRGGDEFARLYLVPGMHHCAGGPGPNQFDMLTALEGWVERGQAPAAIEARHVTNGTVDRTRPLCPHPQVATYTGRGDVDQAASFRCEVPAAGR